MVRVKVDLRLLLNMRVQVKGQRLENEFGHCLCVQDSHMDSCF